MREDTGGFPQSCPSILTGMMEVPENDDIHGMDYGDYLERLNVILKSMVALEHGSVAADTTQYLAKRFDVAMLRDVIQLLLRVESVLARAARS